MFGFFSARYYNLTRVSVPLAEFQVQLGAEQAFLCHDHVQKVWRNSLKPSAAAPVFVNHEHCGG